MTNKQTIDGVPRALLEKAMRDAVLIRFTTDTHVVALRALLDAPVIERQAEGQRERFQKWVLATEHPVFGFLDGRALARGDDRGGYADEYVQGLWVAYKEFAAPPAPVSVVLDPYPIADAVRAALDRKACQNAWMTLAYEAVVDKVKELNS